jgi:hypothetical protein
VLVARARINHPVLVRLALVRGKRVRASARKHWTTGANAIRIVLRPSLRGRWTAELRVGPKRYRRLIRFG